MCMCDVRERKCVKPNGMQADRHREGTHNNTKTQTKVAGKNLTLEKHKVQEVEQSYFKP